MQNVGRRVQRLLMAVAGLFVALFLIFVVNQTLQLAAAAERVAPWLGAVVLWGLLAVYGLGAVVVGWNFLRLPKALRPPRTAEGPEFDAFLARLKGRLRTNPALAERPMDDLEDVQAGLAVLGERADGFTRDAALQAFFVTAISQNGNLDAVAVLTIHARLVYDIARLYYQRPTVRDLLYLYGNVVVSAVVARQLDDWDMTEYVTPIMNATMGSAIGAVPGATAAASAAVQAVLTGSANAYMTLRVGVIARRYCSSVTMPERDKLRDAAFVEAAKMFPGIVAQGTKKVFEIIGAAAVQGTKTALGALGAGMKGAAVSAGQAVRSAGTAVRSAGTAVRGWVGRKGPKVGEPRQGGATSWEQQLTAGPKEAAAAADDDGRSRDGGR